MALTFAPVMSPILDCGLFALEVRCENDTLVELCFVPPGHVRAARTALEREVARQIAAWLKDACFEFTLPLAPRGTPFQSRIWAALREIPPGQTRRYGELAGQLGTAARAVGGACRANPWPLINPCHRVVGVHDEGGFAGERDGWLCGVKRWLIERERRR